MNLREAHALLGTNDDSSLDLVRRAYRDKAFEAHPDRGGSAEALVLLVKARDVALKNAIETPCNGCGGKRVVTIVSGFFSSTQQCATCHGTGRRWP
jgi:DnaJ-class molecular chaperone